MGTHDTLSPWEIHSTHKNQYIAWIDVETSGTSVELNELLEVAAILTNMDGTVVGQPCETLIQVSNLSHVIATADPMIQVMHNQSGLWHDLWHKPSIKNHKADVLFTRWLQNLVDEKATVYFGGNTIVLDRNFLSFHLPRFYQHLSHRSIDVTSLSLAIQSNAGVLGYEKGKKHRALMDAQDSLREYKYYCHWLQNVSKM
jgi:oligoribonuclease